MRKRKQIKTREMSERYRPFVLPGLKEPDSPKPKRITHAGEHGIGLLHFIALLLEANEKMPKHRRMTDTVLKRQILGEFINSTTVLVERLKHGEIDIGYFRSLYNRGDLPPLKRTGKKPDKRSYRYNNKGETIHPKNLQPMPKEAIDALYQRRTPAAPGSSLEGNGDA